MAHEPDIDEGGTHGAGEVLDEVDHALETDRPTLSDIVEHLGRASFTPLLMVPALAVVSPLSGIPGFSSLCGIAIALVSLQMLAGRDHVWLPRWLLRREIGAERAQNALHWFARPAAWLDRMTRRRLQFLVAGPGAVLPRAVCVVSGAMMPLLELLPFTSSILGGVVLLNAIGFQARDGLFVLVGTGFFLGVLSTLFWLVTP